jgi:hypothetical protein
VDSPENRRWKHIWFLRIRRQYDVEFASTPVTRGVQSLIDRWMRWGYRYLTVVGSHAFYKFMQNIVAACLPDTSNFTSCFWVNNLSIYLIPNLGPRPSNVFTGVFGRWRDRARFLTFTGKSCAGDKKNTMSIPNHRIHWSRRTGKTIRGSINLKISLVWELQTCKVCYIMQ